MRPPAAVDPLAAAQGGQVDDGAVDHITVVPVVGASPQKNHGPDTDDHRGENHGGCYFIAPEVATGFSYIAAVYHPDPLHGPANRGYNVMFQYGGQAGYKFKKWGATLGVYCSHFNQNLDQKNLSVRNGRKPC